MLFPYFNCMFCLSNDYLHLCRSEFEHLSKLLWSRTIGSSSLKPEDGSIRKMPLSEQENGSRRSSLPVDFSIRISSVAVSKVLKAVRRTPSKVGRLDA